MILIAVTGWGQDGDRAQSRMAGCNGHLVKPVNPAELNALLDTLLAESGESGQLLPSEGAESSRR
jgi:DNA-binding response OmpR family regulator